ncbi:hypothetical protein B0T24DRAFT_641977 [Lasiosphaeria ovina]|uniref:Prion-inhibition and propagation HeLo domain-containing protein n=1 Tax=Lasiosphaeria ovina TaxID=92902 RepID=A0AAE0JU58_9PEZI|nr:hypothetical protein B0T24DRAFT_641977 [Lasiosphaeria ovina]
MDVGDIVFGSLSLLGLVATVESCVQGYDQFVASAREAPDRSNKFAIYVRIEQRRFQLYWEYMGLSTTDCPLLREQSRTTQELIVDIAGEVKTLLLDAQLLSRSYGAEAMPPRSSEAADLEIGPNTLSTSSTILDRLLGSDWFGQRPTLTRRQSLVWVWKDEKKAMGLLKDLRGFNKQLWTSLAPQHEILLKQGEPAWILPGLNDVWAIQRLAGGETPGDLDDPLTVCSGLRTARLQPDSVQDIPFHEMKPATLQVEQIADNNLGPNRYLACFNGRNVIVEYKRGDPSMTSNDKAVSGCLR